MNDQRKLKLIEVWEEEYHNMYSNMPSSGIWYNIIKAHIKTLLQQQAALTREETIKECMDITRFQLYRLENDCLTCNCKHGRDGKLRLIDKNKLIIKFEKLLTKQQ